MSIVFRVDANPHIGTGHLTRCCALATLLKKKKHDVSFLMVRPDESIKRRIQEVGATLEKLSMDESVFGGKGWIEDARVTTDFLKHLPYQADLIVDHYSLDAKWEKQVASYTRKIMVIDDQANRPHECDALLDQNYYLDMKGRYQRWIPERTQKFLGPEYLLFRDEFRTFSKEKIRPIPECNSIFIFFGGSDPCGLTMRVLKILEQPEFLHFELHVVVGALNLQKGSIEELCRKRGKANFYCDIPRMSDVMIKADLALIPGGTTTWEVLKVGLPCIALVAAENQMESVRDCAESDLLVSLGWHASVSDQRIAETIRQLSASPEKRSQLRANGWNLLQYSGLEEVLNFFDN